MADKVDMSLDDIIKFNRKKNVKGQKARGKPTRNKATIKGRKGKFQGIHGSMKGPKKGGVVKRRRSDGGAPFSKNKALRYAVQRHNKMGKSPLKQLVPGRKRSLSEGAGGVTKLLISNLDFGVNIQDIRELFGEFGPLKKATVHFDQNGRSLGSAEVVFEKKQDAIKAHKRYNNIPLDGRAMNIELVGDFAAMKVTAVSRLGQKMVLRGRGNAMTRKPFKKGGFNVNYGNKFKGRGGHNGRNMRGSRGKFSGNRGGRNAQGTTPSKEDLDAQLDAYNSNSMQTE